MSCNHRKFNSAEVLRWIKDIRIDRPWFCATSGNTLIIQRFITCGSTVYEFTWNNSKTPIDDPQLTESAWSFDITEADIPDALYYADDETEAQIEELKVSANHTNKWRCITMMTENEQIDLRNDLDAAYPCPDIDCDGVVEYETTGYWQCSECSFRTKHIENKTKLQGWRL